MAEEIKKVISVDTSEAQKNIQNLGGSFKSLKEAKQYIDQATASLIGMDEASEEYKDRVSEVQAVQQQLNNALNATKGSAGAAEGSYAALSQQMANLKKEWKATADEAKRNELGKQINEINNKLKGMDSSIGVFSRNVGNYKSAFVDAFSSAVPAIGKVNTSLKALAVNPVGAAITALVVVFSALRNGISNSETTSNKFKAAMATFKPVIAVVTNAMQFLVDKFVDFVSWLSQAYVNVVRFASQAANFFGLDGVAKKLGETSDNMRELKQIEEAHNEALIAKRKLEEDLATEEARRAELLGELQTNESLTAAQRKQYIQEIKDSRKQAWEEERKIMQAELDYLEAQAKLSANSAEENDKIAQAKKALADADRRYYSDMRGYDRQTSSYTESTSKAANAIEKVASSIDELLKSQGGSDTIFKKVSEELKTIRRDAGLTTEEISKLKKEAAASVTEENPDTIIAKMEKGIKNLNDSLLPTLTKSLTKIYKTENGSPAKKVTITSTGIVGLIVESMMNGNRISDFQEQAAEQLDAYVKAVGDAIGSGDINKIRSAIDAFQNKFNEYIDSNEKKNKTKDRKDPIVEYFKGISVQMTTALRNYDRGAKQLADAQKKYEQAVQDAENRAVEKARAQEKGRKKNTVSQDKLQKAANAAAELVKDLADDSLLDDAAKKQKERVTAYTKALQQLKDIQELVIEFQNKGIDTTKLEEQLTRFAQAVQKMRVQIDFGDSLGKLPEIQLPTVNVKDPIHEAMMDSIEKRQYRALARKMAEEMTVVFSDVARSTGSVFGDIFDFNFDNANSQLAGMIDTLNDFKVSIVKIGVKFDDVKEAFKSNWKEITSVAGGAISGLSDAISGYISMRRQMLDADLKAGDITEEEYDKRLNNTRDVETANAIISALGGSVTAFAESMKLGPIVGPIVGGALSAAMMAMGAVNARMIKQTKKGSTSASGGSCGSFSPNIASVDNYTVQRLASSVGQETGTQVAQQQSTQRVVLVESDLELYNTKKVGLEQDTEF